MEIVSGFSTVCPGIGIGIVEIESENCCNRSAFSDNSFTEARSSSAWERYLSALIRLKQKLADDIRSCPDVSLREILDCQLMILEDEELSDEVKSALEDASADASAVEQIYTAYAQRIFGGAVQGPFAFRSEDLICLGQMISDLMRQHPSCAKLEEKIFFCDHVRLSHVLLQNNISGIAERTHIVSTHASAIMKAHGIPAVYGINPKPSWQGKRAILDADNGLLILEPSAQMICKYHEKSNHASFNAQLSQAIPRGAKILATVNSSDDARLLSAISDASIDVGLVRTEMLFLNRTELPDEDEQYRMYQSVSNLLPNRTLTFRSFDFGGDKYDSMPESWKKQGIAQEQKGVSAMLMAEEDFLHQLRSILRLSRHHSVRILFPYITDSSQLSRIEKLLDLIYAEEEFSDLSRIEKGFMIENTAALSIADEIISRSDFVSVGTNDLLKSVFPSVIVKGYDSFGDEEWAQIAHIIRELAFSVHRAQKTLTLCGEVSVNSRLLFFLDSADIDYISLMTKSVEMFIKGEAHDVDIAFGSKLSV